MPVYGHSATCDAVDVQLAVPGHLLTALHELRPRVGLDSRISLPSTAIDMQIDPELRRYDGKSAIDNHSAGVRAKDKYSTSVVNVCPAV